MHQADAQIFFRVRHSDMPRIFSRLVRKYMVTAIYAGQLPTILLKDFDEFRAFHGAYFNMKKMGNQHHNHYFFRAELKNCRDCVLLQLRDNPHEKPDCPARRPREEK